MERLHGHSKEIEKQLTGEHRVGDAGQVIFIFIFLGVWIADSFALKYTTFLNHSIPVVARIVLAVILFIFSGYMAMKGMHIVFGQVREKPEVIREGVFNKVRHPIYLSEILLYLALICLSISLAAAIVWILTIVFLHFISRYEERLLLERFGEAYEQYMREVPMWIPRLGKKGD